MGGMALLGSEWFIVIRYAATILSIIMIVFAIQGRMWWWLIPLVPIAVVWNPVLPLTIEEQAWPALQFLAAVAMVIAGIMIRVPTPREGREQRR